MKSAVLFDLGGTLVEYFERLEFPVVLREAISGVRAFLRERGLLGVSEEEMWDRVRQEDYESMDHRVRPLEGRLCRIFGLEEGSQRSGLTILLCEVFMKPIFARGRLYEDAIPVLQELRSRGVRTAVVSNTTWGSPAELWREEVRRLGLSEQLDAAVFCRDAGWRKPARQVFELALGTLGASCADCLFVGDDPRWDLAGANGVGMEAVLVFRRQGTASGYEATIRTLYEVLDRV